MAFGIFVIGDEILSGRRQDKHFAKALEILHARGLALAWASYLGDERPRLVRALRDSLAGDDVVISFGGIGATPDDHTRQAAAEALGVPLVEHPEAQALIAAHMASIGQPVTPERRRMGELPRGAELIPNPYNRIPGFSLGRHHFLPGFPIMAWPMLEWLLDTHYRDLFGSGTEAARGMVVTGLNEGMLTPLLDAVEREFPGVRTWSLPRIEPEISFHYEIDLGVKGPEGLIDTAFARLREGVQALGGQIKG
ncbi:MAG: molybdopterin-binding protein [Pseudomonadota bacterium]